MQFAYMVYFLRESFIFNPRCITLRNKRKRPISDIMMVILCSRYKNKTIECWTMTVTNSHWPCSFSFQYYLSKSSSILNECFFSERNLKTNMDVYIEYPKNTSRWYLIRGWLLILSNCYYAINLKAIFKINTYTQQIFDSSSFAHWLVIDTNF